jgi:hypothetical protein
MKYLNLALNYFEHPKITRLVGLLGKGSELFPIKLWTYCGRVHPKDGALKGYQDKEIEAIIGFDGNQNGAVSAMIAVGIIKRTKRGFSCVDWHQHQGHLEAFSRRASIAAIARWSKYAPSNATSIAKIKTSNAPSVPSVPTKPTIPNQHNIGATAPHSQPNPDVKTVVDFYHSAFLAKFGRKPEISAKDPAVVKRVLESGTRLEDTKSAITWAIANKPDMAASLSACMSAYMLNASKVGNASKICPCCKQRERPASRPNQKLCNECDTIYG